MAELNPLIPYLKKYQEALIQLDFLREIFMIPERVKGAILENGNFILRDVTPMYRGKFFVYQDFFYCVDGYQRDYSQEDVKTYEVTAFKTDIAYSPLETDPFCTPQDDMIIVKGDISNYTEDTSLLTTIGRFIANYLLLAYPFNNVIPYLNEEFKETKLEKLISLPLLEGKINIRDFKDKYTNSLTLFGGCNDLFCPNITEKTITIPKEITELREKLIEDNKDALKAGDVTVMTEIENTLIKAYKDYLKDDPSMHFLLKSKYFNVTLKKLFLTHGITEVFGSPGKFVFIDNPLSNGWKQEDLVPINNEVREGSYARAIQTADGGVISKLILRVFQDTRIDIPDCGTMRGELIKGEEQILKDFLWSYLIEEDGTTSLITEEKIPTLLGKDLKVRTPGYCQAPKGFCAKCFGYIFEKVGQEAFAPIANDFGRNQVTAALKRMHGSSKAVTKIENLNKYLF